VNQPVLSGTRTLVLSGTANPAYQEPKPNISLEAASQNRAPNFPNKESFGFLLTRSVRWGLSDAAARTDVASLGNTNVAVTP